MLNVFRSSGPRSRVMHASHGEAIGVPQSSARLHKPIGSRGCRRSPVQGLGVQGLRGSGVEGLGV